MPRWPTARFGSSAPRSTRRNWRPRLLSPAENGSIWIEHHDEVPNSNDDSALARGRVDSAGAGRDFGELSRLLPAQFRFALPTRPRGDVHRRLPGGVLRPHCFRSARAVQRVDPAERNRSPSSRRLARLVGSGSGRRSAVIRTSEQRGDVPARLRRLAGGAKFFFAIGGGRELCDRRCRLRAPPPLRPAPSLDDSLLCLDLFGGNPSSDLGDGGTGRGAESRGRVYLRGLEQLAVPAGGLRDRGALISAAVLRPDSFSR